MGENLIVSTGSAGKVPIEVNSFQSSAWDAITAARDALEDMTNSHVSFPEGTAAPGTAVGNITYTPPGIAPVWSFTFEPPTWNISDPILSPVTKNTVADFTGDAPVSVAPNLPSRPNPGPVTAPGDAPGTTSVVIPDAPTLDSIPDPKEWIITLPTAPTVEIGSFTAQRPSAGGIVKPSSEFSWNENPYTSQTLTEVETQISAYFAGGVGIPGEIWEAIWAKDNDRENRAGEKLIEEINDEWSARGFQLPQGVQVAQIAQARQDIQSTASGRSRDIAIQESNLEIENLKFAVQQGLALENLRGGWHQTVQARLLEATKFSSELAISVFNAEIGFYNAQVQMYLADVTVYKAEIEAEIIALNVYKTELEGQKLVGDLNQQEVDKYVARIQALSIDIDLYNSVLQGIKTTVESDAVRIDGYRSEVQAFGERIKAINSEYEGYATAMQGAKIEAEIFDSNVKAYASTVQAYATKVDAESKNSGIDIAINKYKLEEYNLLIQGFISELDAEVKNLQAQATAFDSENKAYIAGIESQKASIQAQTAKYTGDIQLASQLTQVNISNAETNAKNALAEAGIIQQGLDSIAKINGAYAGSAMAAVNIGMSMSDSASNSASA